MSEAGELRYLLAAPGEGPGASGSDKWMIYLGTPQGGTVILELPGDVPRLDAVKARKALADARGLGRREMTGRLTSFAQSLRMAPE